MLKLIAYISLVAVGVPFEDTHHRFTIDLPAGWTFAPMPGDTQGASFRKTSETDVAQASIRIVQLEPNTDLDAFVKKMSAWVASEAGYRQLAYELTFAAGGQPAMRLRYVVGVEGNPKLSKVVEERFLIIGQAGYVLHVEAMADGFGRLESDFQQLFASFAPQTKNKAVAASTAPTVQPPAENAQLVGRWIMLSDRNTAMVFRNDGTLEIDDYRGVFQVRGDQLITRMMGTDAERFTWSMQGDVLTMASPNLPEPITYAREGTPAALVGIWVGPDVRWQMSLSGTLTWGADQGSFKTDSGQLIVSMQSGKRYVFQYAQKGDVLMVSGEKFGKGIQLKRQAD